MSNVFSPTPKPEILHRIREAVMYLEVPNDALLVDAASDMQRQVMLHRVELELRLEQSRADGLNAAARILMSPEDLKNKPGSDYFNR